MTNKIIVIGSNSFSGSDFIDLLLEDKNNDVVGISRSKEKDSVFLPYKRHKKARFHFYRLDLNKNIKEIIRLLDRFKPKYIVNFAAQSEVAPSWKYPDQWYLTNVISLVRLTDYLRKCSYLKRFLQVSSPEVYGPCNGVTEETAVLNPSTPYAASKAAADLFLLTLIKHYNFPAVTVRSTNVYGAHQQLFKIIPKSIISVKLGRRIDLDGGGKAIKSYIHIRDISKGELAILKRGKIGEIYHLSPKKGISIKELVELICDKLNVDFRKFTRVVSERPGQDSSYIIDSTKAGRSLGWKPTVSIDKGIEGVIEWINNDWDKIRKMPFSYRHKP